jgi:phthalate 4,5-cis-dihydrodiol dehydrogenase
LTFESGAFASITYSGYAHFDSDEFMGWIAESGYPKDPDQYGTARALLSRATSKDDEVVLKNARNYGGGEAPPAVQERRSHQQFGVLIASCERGDLRPLPNGVAIYDDVSRRFEAIADPQVPRAGVIDELCNAVFFGRAPPHNGEWGLATMEVCLGILQSAREQREIVLQHQTSLSA